MANQRIRRSSMENLCLLDLDRWAHRTREDEVPPLPPPRPHFRSSMIEHSRTLYDVTRSQNDPIYARTPMFTTIPRTNQEFQPRRIIGAHVPPEIIRPNSTPSAPSTPRSANKPKDTEAEDERTEEEDDKDEKEDSPQKTNKNDDDDDRSDGGSDDNGSSTDSDEKKSDDDDDDDDEILKDDDDDKRGIVEQIFNRDKPK